MKRLSCMVLMAMPLIAALMAAATDDAEKAEKVCGVYASITSFASEEVMRQASSHAPFLMEKHRKMLAGTHNAAEIARAREAGFNTVFMTIYPLHGHDWWSVPDTRALVPTAAD